MYKWPDETKQIISEVLQASNPIECLKQFIYNPFAKDITFLLFDGNAETNFKSISHEFSLHKYNIVNLGCYERMILINTSILSAKQNSIPIRTEYLINLDSNIASFLSKIIKNNQIEDCLWNFLYYIKKNNLNLSMVPYVLEDSLNSTGMQNNDRAYECLLSFFTFDRVTLDEFKALPCIPNVDDYCCADNAWMQMRYTRYYERKEEKRVRSIYCFLLQVYIIHFQSKRSPKNKIIELINFINNELGAYFEAGVILAYWFFNKSYKCVNRFFQKIQPTSKNKLKDIEGMAFDLFHLWDMPTEMAILTQRDDAIVLKGLATHDDALAQIAKLNPITRIAFYAEEAQVKYTFSIQDVLTENYILESLASKKIKREKLCPTVDLIQLSKVLEKKLYELTENNEFKD